MRLRLRGQGPRHVCCTLIVVADRLSDVVYSREASGASWRPCDCSTRLWGRRRCRQQCARRPPRPPAQPFQDTLPEHLPQRWQSAWSHGSPRQGEGFPSPAECGSASPGLQPRYITLGCFIKSMREFLLLKFCEDSSCARLSMTTM